uniref:Uncharacterized protein n=1 Tax=Ditylenchus dipsaci TaxID=166011 RepID=A0A915CVS6_9BILA
MKFEFFKRKEPQPFYAQKDELKSNPLFFSAFDSTSLHWFEDHLPLRGRRSDTRRADSVARGNCPSTQSKASCPQKISQSVVKKASRSAAPPRLRYSSASSDVAGKIYPYGSEKKRRSGQKMVVSHEEPAINYFKDYDHQEYDSGDDEDDDDEEDEFLLITTSGYAAAAARPQMATLCMLRVVTKMRFLLSMACHNLLLRLVIMEVDPVESQFVPIHG